MNVIQNLDALAVTTLRKDALAIAEAGYAAIDVGDVIRRKIRIENGRLTIADASYPLTGRNVFFVGVGKCALRAAHAVEKVLGDTLTAGFVLDVSDDGEGPLPKMQTFIGTHPLPSEENERATKGMLDFLTACRDDDLVIMLISGGGSALLSQPEAPMTYQDESALYTLLTARGAPIEDMNIVRKHISRARGGGLAVAAYPAEVVSLIVSDVSGNDIAAVASGPTILDSSTVEDAQAILKRYDIPAKNSAFIESAKDPKYFTRVTNTLFLSSQEALVAMHEEATRLGYATSIVDTHFAGEAQAIGTAIAKKLHTSAPKTALLYAGESTVTLERNAGNGPSTSLGTGGRNQEMALASLREIRNDELILPFASDGQDNGEYAAGIADDVTRAHISEKKLSTDEYLDSHRSYDFFAKIGDALLTGNTGSNVSDLIIALKT